MGVFISEGFEWGPKAMIGVACIAAIRKIFIRDLPQSNANFFAHKSRLIEFWDYFKGT